MDSTDTSRQRRRPKAKRLTVLGVAGEFLMTFGMFAVLFVVWEFWWTGVEADAVQDQAVAQFIQDTRPTSQPPAAPNSAVEPGHSELQEGYGPIQVGEEPAAGETFGIVYIPRFGENYTRPLAEGTGDDVLDTLGLGRYPSTTMPGEPGNFAVAGHRQTHGAVLDNIHTLVPGDKIYVQTVDGFYTYVYRNTEIVLPDRSDVLLPVPTEPGAIPEESVLTLTSCNPMFGEQERIIAYSTLNSWQPLSAGPPEEIAVQVAALQEEG